MDDKFIEVEHVFTDDEKVKLADKMADDSIEAMKLEDEKKAYDKEQKGLIDARHSEVSRVAKLYKEGKETKSIFCKMTIDREKQERLWHSIDDGSFVKSEPFAEGDDQEDLFEGEEGDALPDADEVNAQVSEAEKTFVDEHLPEDAPTTDEPPSEDPEDAPQSEDVFDQQENGGASDVDETLGVVVDEDAAAEADEVFENGAPFEITDSHSRVLSLTKAHTGTEPLSFAANTKGIRTAAEFLLSADYIMGSDHASVTGLSPKGIALFDGGHVIAMAA